MSEIKVSRFHPVKIDAAELAELKKRDVCMNCQMWTPPTGKRVSKGHCQMRDCFRRYDSGKGCEFYCPERELPTAYDAAPEEVAQAAMKIAEWMVLNARPSVRVSGLQIQLAKRERDE